jgi:CheY-like chemotaxis protein
MTDLRILIVDDSTLCRALLAKALEDLGPVTEAAGGLQALALFSAARAQGTPFSFVCLDIGMQDLDGRRTLVAIREIERHLRPTLPASRIAMTTGEKSLSSVKGAFRDQADFYFTKPLDIDSVRSQISEISAQALPKIRVVGAVAESLQAPFAEIGILVEQVSMPAMQALERPAPPIAILDGADDNIISICEAARFLWPRTALGVAVKTKTPVLDSCQRLGITAPFVLSDPRACQETALALLDLSRHWVQALRPQGA